MRILAFCLAATLQAQVNAPKVGTARFSDHTVRAIYGLPADYVLGKQSIPSADAISFSDSAGLLSRDGDIQLVGRDGTLIAEYNCGETTPLLNIDGDVETAIAWLPSHHAILHWDGKSFALTPFTGAIFERVSSVRLQSPGSARLLLVDSSSNVFEASVSLETGDLISLNLLPGVRGSAFQQGSYIVFHDQEGLEIQSSGGSLRTLPLRANDLTFERMSSDVWHLASTAAKQDWVLHLNGSVLKLSQLPALPEAAR